MSILIIVAVNPKMRVFPPSQKVVALLNLCSTSSLWIGQNQVGSDSKVIKMLLLFLIFSDYLELCFQVNQRYYYKRHFGWVNL